MNVQDRVTEMRLVPADQLIANPANWRRHPQAQQRALAAVLDEVGFAGAVIAREDEDGGLVIIDGHARAEMVGEATVPVLVTDLTEAEADVVLATYDPIGAMAQKDHEAFATLAARIDTANETLLGLLGRTKDGETDPDDVPDVPEEAQSITGVVYELGPHRVMCGDAFVDGLTFYADPKINAVLADPPYGRDLDTDYSAMPEKAVKGVRYDPVAGDDEPFDPRPLFTLFEGAKDQWWWGGDWYYDKLPVGGSWLIWDKRTTDGVPNEGSDAMIGNHFEAAWSMRPHRRELIRHQWAGVTARNRQWARAHPTEKPIAVAVQILERWTKEDGAIADPFLGSGTTLIACEQTGRTCYGMEIDPRYVDVIRQRYADFVGDPSLAPNG